MRDSPVVPPTGAQEQNQPRVSMQSRSRARAGLGISETWRESKSCCVCPPLPNSLMLLWATPDLRGLGAARIPAPDLLVDNPWK